MIGRSCNTRRFRPGQVGRHRQASQVESALITLSLAHRIVAHGIYHLMVCDQQPHRGRPHRSAGPHNDNGADKLLAQAS